MNWLKTQRGRIHNLTRENESDAELNHMKICIGALSLLSKRENKLVEEEIQNVLISLPKREIVSIVLSLMSTSMYNLSLVWMDTGMQDVCKVQAGDVIGMDFHWYGGR